MLHLDLTLRPNPALGHRPQALAVAGAAVMMGLGALRFLLLGAWMVLPFMLVDLALLAWALHTTSRRAARAALIRLDDRELTVEERDGGALRLTRFDPASTRAADGGPGTLLIESRGKRVRLCGYLTARERADVVNVIEAALARRR
jgi:uncharacterized membrane protein